MDVHAQAVKSQDELEVRTMQDSYQEAVIPLGSDLARRQEYVNFFQMARYVTFQLAALDFQQVFL